MNRVVESSPKSPPRRAARVEAPGGHLLRNVLFGVGALVGVVVAWRSFPSLRRYVRMKRM